MIATLIADVTVNPDVNTHTLERLKSGTPYEVQVSGFTRAGVGVRSEPRAFTTGHPGQVQSPLLHSSGFLLVGLNFFFL